MLRLRAFELGHLRLEGRLHLAHHLRDLLGPLGAHGLAVRGRRHHFHVRVRTQRFELVFQLLFESGDAVILFLELPISSSLEAAHVTIQLLELARQGVLALGP